MSGLVLCYGGGKQQKLDTRVYQLAHRGKERAILQFEGVQIGFVGPKAEEGVFLDGQVFFEEHPLDPKELLFLYNRYGVSFLNEITGAFVFALYGPGMCFVVRDPLGIKPLYYALEEGVYYFASEIKALVGLPRISPVPPGVFFHSDFGFRTYAFEPKVDLHTHTLEETKKTLRDYLCRAVGRSITKDSCALLLSGGLDSSVIAFAAKKQGSKVYSFAAGTKDSQDRQSAKIVAEHLGLEHHFLCYDLEQILKVLSKVIYHLESFDQYLVRSAVVNYLLAGFIAEQGFDSVLCGEGADELFAGYAYLKELPSDRVIEQELGDLLKRGSSNCFQRVDRMTQAFGLEGRMPFMDTLVTQYARGLPLSFKLHPRGVDKWILREAFSSVLPPSIIWREKMKFFEGAGSDTVLSNYANQVLSDQEFFAEKNIEEDCVLVSKEELLYFRIYSQFFSFPATKTTLGRTRV